MAVKLDTLKKLSKREKYAVLTALIFICVFIVFQFVAVPAVKKKHRLERTLVSSIKRLDEMVESKAEYDTLKKRTEMNEARFSTRDKNFTLTSFVNGLAEKAGIKNMIAYMKPSSSAVNATRNKISRVEMKLKAVPLKELISFLHMIETSENMVFLKKISISKEGRGKQQINAVLHLETIEIGNISIAAGIKR